MKTTNWQTTYPVLRILLLLLHIHKIRLIPYNVTQNMERHFFCFFLLHMTGIVSITVKVHNCDGL